MKSYLKTAVVTLILAFLLHLIVHRLKFTIKSLSDVIFFVGIMTFFIGITSISGANRVFITLGYSFRSVFGRQHKHHENFYEYTQAKDKKKYASYGPPMIIIGIIMVMISLFLAYLSLK